MSKVLIELFIPAIADHVDVLVPVDIPIRDLTKVIIDGIVELTNGVYIPSHGENLCMKEPMGILNPMLSLFDYGVIDGAQLYLV